MVRNYLLLDKRWSSMRKYAQGAASWVQVSPVEKAPHNPQHQGEQTKWPDR